ncbi:unnamed protein product [Clavelina lepadiformis]|uniref:LRRK2 ARM repeat domain-containing protein n=1 Tax=Clavelina lepadiformis TaxID=159417 RepID=A0ABP0H5T9_CLALP
MEKALKILNSEQDPDEISRACQIAVDVMKKCKQTKYDQWPEKFNIDQVTSCLMTVFLSNFENPCHVLTSATDALIHLIQLNPKSKIDLARKGIFFNIVKLFWFQNTSSREVCALSSLRLSVALVDDCHHNLLSCKDADLISLVPDALTLYEDDKYILVNCLQLLSILLCETENDNFEIKEWRNSWKKLCFLNSVYICVLDIMNKYVADTPMLQLFSLKCLKAFTGGAIKQMQEHGVIDTILHTCERHDGDSAVELEAFQLLEIIMEKASTLFCLMAIQRLLSCNSILSV